MGPNGPMRGPNGPMMGPVPQQGPIVTPAMRRLMQTIEQRMLETRAFISLPMIDQFHLVHGIVNQFLNVPNFVSMSPDDKIRFLISGQNGFTCAHTFTLFTYPQQLQLLSLIQLDYINTTKASAVPTVATPAVMNITAQIQNEPENRITFASKDDKIVAPWQKKPTTSSTSFGTEESAINFDTISAQDRYEKATRLQASFQENQTVQDPETLSNSSDSDQIPPAPEPPQFNPTRSPSISPPTLPAQLNRVQSPGTFYRRSRSRSISRSRRSPTPSLSPPPPRILSPFSSALLSSPLLRYNRSLSKSPVDDYRRGLSPVRSNYRHNSPSPMKRTRSPSPLSYVPRYSPPRTKHRYRSRSPERLEKHYRPQSPPSRKQRSRSPLWDDDQLMAKSSGQYTIGASTDSMCSVLLVHIAR